jgi:hypothetical protein
MIFIFRRLSRINKRRQYMKNNCLCQYYELCREIIETRFLDDDELTMETLKIMKSFCKDNDSCRHKENFDEAFEFEGNYENLSS